MSDYKRPKSGGRKKGTPNKTTASVKKAIMEAFKSAGEAEYLARVAEEDPKTFCALLGRVLPAEVKAELDHSGDIDHTVRILFGKDGD